MSDKTCLGCGGLTNTVVCDYLKHDDWQPRKCFARFEDGRWVKGCGYDEADEYMSDMRKYVDMLVEATASNQYIPLSLVKESE